MALQTKQIADLNALNQKIAGGYTPTATDKANLDYATQQGYKPIPTGATKIASPSGLQGLNESQLFRQGQDIYKLPESITSEQITGNVPNVPVVEPDPTDINSMMAGVKTGNEGLQAQLAARDATLKEQTNLTELQKRQADYADANKTAQTDTLNKTLNQYGLDENVAQVQKLMPQIASRQAAFDNAIMAQEGKTASASSIYGRQALLQRQQAVEVAGLSAIAQAYQGNVDMASNLANDAVNAQYQDQVNYTNSLNEQIRNAYTDLSAAEQKRADKLLMVNNERLANIEAEKEMKNNINNIAMTLASKGIDTSIVNQVMKAPTLEEAIRIASASGGLTTISGLQDLGDGNFLDENTGIIGTIDEIKQAQNLSQGIVTTSTGDAYDIASYATDPTHEAKIQSILNGIGQFNTIQDIDNYIQSKYPNSPVTGQMIANSATKYGVSWEMMTAIMAQDSSMGTAGKAVRTKNPGNVGNTDDGSTKNFNSWQEGVDAVAKNLEWRKTESVSTAGEVEQVITEDGYDVSKFTPEFYNTDFGQKVINNEQQQFNSFKGEQIVKDYNSVQNKAASVQSIIDSGVGGPGDLALVFEFMKSLDPTSVVRESEYEAAAKSGNIFAGAYARFNGYLKEKGGFLPEQVKNAFLDITNQKLGVIENQYGNLRGEYRRIAASQGLNPENVAPNLTITETQQQSSPESEWLSSEGFSSDISNTEIVEQPKSSVWNWFRGLVGAKPQNSMMENINELNKK